MLTIVILCQKISMVMRFYAKLFESLLFEAYHNLLSVYPKQVKTHKRIYKVRYQYFLWGLIAWIPSQTMSDIK
jgi:hypothetical protein